MIGRCENHSGLRAEVNFFRGEQNATSVLSHSVDLHAPHPPIYGLPEKYVRIFPGFLNGNASAVRANGEPMDWFNVNSGCWHWSGGYSGTSNLQILLELCTCSFLGGTEKTISHGVVLQRKSTGVAWPFAEVLPIAHLSEEIILTWRLKVSLLSKLAISCTLVRLSVAMKPLTETGKERPRKKVEVLCTGGCG